MALIIVRNDITKMKVDAIVNPTNRHLDPGFYDGSVDAIIHELGGPELINALEKIGTCEPGSAVITPSFGIKTCKYIIHCVSPVYRGGYNGEYERLENCYRTVLSLALEKKCKSIAFPAIGTGTNRFPKAEAYRVATTTIRNYLLSLDTDMKVFLVLHNTELAEISRKVDGEIRDYIAKKYPEQVHKKTWQDAPLKACAKKEYSKQQKKIKHAEPEAKRHVYAEAEYSMTDAYLQSRVEKEYTRPRASKQDQAKKEPVMQSVSARVQANEYTTQNRSFAEMCEWWMDQKGISIGEFYSRANILRATFSRLRTDPQKVPKKNTALACAIGLKLNYDQTQDLLMRAGLFLSSYYESDLIVEYFIHQKNYDIDLINFELANKNLPTLGASMK